MRAAAEIRFPRGMLKPETKQLLQRRYVGPEDVVAFRFSIGFSSPEVEFGHLAGVAKRLNKAAETGAAIGVVIAPEIVYRTANGMGPYSMQFALKAALGRKLEVHDIFRKDEEPRV